MSSGDSEELQLPNLVGYPGPPPPVTPTSCVHALATIQLPV